MGDKITATRGQCGAITVEALEPIKCQQCKGTGAHWTRILNLGNHEIETHYVSCMAVGCRNGVFDRERYYAEFSGWGLPAVNCATCM